MTDSTSPIKPQKTSSQVWMNWLVYIVLAIILAFWSIVASLFFLGVVWIMRQNPDPGSSFEVGKTEKSTARRVYTWLFFSSLITVPVFILVLNESYSSRSTNNQYVLSALAPLVFHLPLLLGLTSKSVFVYRHVQQGILLITLRAGTAAMLISIGDIAGLMLFVLVNGSLWLFGSIWGWTQVNRGECWWMKQKGGKFSIKDVAPPNIDPHTKISPEKHIEYSTWYLKHELRNVAKEHALEAFRHGNWEIRRRAVRILDELNEVEFF